MKEKSIIQQNLKKIIGVIVVSVFAIITIYTVFRGSGISLNELTASLKEASWEGILLASVSMLGFIYFEGEALRVLVRHMGYPAKRSHGFVYSAADVYFSAITPSASGGQPASAYFMLKDGIAGTAVMAALLLNLIMYTLAILTIGLVDILIFPEVFLNFSIGCRVLIVAGGLALAGLGIIFYLLLRKQALIESVGTFFVRILRMIHCGRLADKLEKKLEVSIEKYSSLVDVIFLAYFNVMEEEDQNRDETGAKIYTGLPVTSAALIFPAVLLIHMLIRADLTFLYFGVMLITGGLFISKIQIKKPQNKGIATMIFFGAVECVVLIFALKFLKK